MRLLLLIIAVCCLAPGSKAQNLVVNPSFEDITGCPLGPGELQRAAPWRDPFQNLVGDTCSTSDLFNTCSPFGALGVGVPANILGNESARTGVGYAGIIVYEGFALIGCQTLFGSGWREYLHGELTEPMVAGQTYCVSFHVSLADAVKFASPNIGVHFSATPLNVSCATVSGSSVLPVSPQLEYAGPEIVQTAGWQRLQWDYTATGGEQYLVIGNFRNDANTSFTCVNEAAFNPYAYYYVDDVSVVPEPCCEAEVAPVPSLCLADAPVELQPVTPGGTWSGPGIADPDSPLFDPALAGVGVHTVFHTIPCGTDSVVIAVSPCDQLVVCLEDDGTWTVSGGVGPYDWQEETTTEDCSACFIACAFPPGCAVDVTVWSTFATGTTVPAPSTFPVQVVDAAGNGLLLVDASGVLPCVVCPTLALQEVERTDVACFGEATGAASVEASGGTEPYTYVWQPGNLIGAAQQGLSAGTYAVTATDAAGCTGALDVVIGQPESAPVVSVMGTTPTTCGGADGTATAEAIGGTSPYSYVWAPAGGAAATATGLAEGSYTVTVTDANGCTAQAEASVSSEPTVAVITGATQLCSGDSLLLTASGGFSYLWNTGDTTATIVILTGGTYAVQVSGCGSDEASVDVAEVTVTAQIAATPDTGDAPLDVVFTNGSLPQDALFSWDLGDGNTFSGIAPAHTYSEPGVYNVVMTATSAGCSAMDSLVVVVNAPVEESDILVPNVFSPNGDGQNDVWGPVGGGLVSLDAQVFNRWGQLVASLSAPGQVWNGRTGAGEEVPDGTYWYVLEAQGADGRRYELTGSITLLR